MPIEFNTEMYGDWDMYVRMLVSVMCTASKLNWHLEFRMLQYTSVVRISQCVTLYISMCAVGNWSKGY